MFNKPPTVSKNPNADVPLAAIVEFETAAPATAQVEVSDGKRTWTVAPSGEPAHGHNIPLLGLRPATAHVIKIGVNDTGGARSDWDGALEFATDPLPDDFPPIQVTRCQPSKRDTGFVFTRIASPPRENVRRSPPFVVGFDRQGEVAYFRRGGTHVRSLQNGNLLSFADGSITESDLLGNTLRQWHTKRARADGAAGGLTIDWDDVFHHNFCEMPNGNFLFITHKWGVVDDFPSDELDATRPPVTVRLATDVILEIEPATGSIMTATDMTEVLDPYRICFNSTRPMRQGTGELADARDWAHVNGVAYDERDDCLIISTRRQNAIVKVRRQTGELVWILGNHNNWRAPWADKLLTLKGDSIWQYHQHDPSVTPGGRILCFDNGNFRGDPPHDVKMEEAGCYSRAVEFEIDDNDMTARQVWSFGDPENYHLFGAHGCGTTRLPQTGNIFSTFGNVYVDRDGKSVPRPGHRCEVHLVEVTHEDSAEIVFEAVVRDECDDPVYYSAFRSEYVPLGALRAP